MTDHRNVASVSTWRDECKINRPIMRYISLISHVIMKKLLLLLALFTCLGTYAQKHSGLYLIPSAGISLGGFDTKKASINWYNADAKWSFKSGLGFKAGVAVGYERQKWSVNTGVYFLNQWSSDAYTYSVYDGHFSSSDGKGYESVHSEYLLLPLSVSYRQKISGNGKPVWFVPCVGAEVGRIIARISDGWDESHWQIYDGVNFRSGSHSEYYHRELKEKELSQTYNRWGMWVMAKVDLEFETAANRAFTIGPEFHYMASVLSKDGGNDGHGYSCLINLGYKLCRR